MMAVSEPNHLGNTLLGLERSGSVCNNGNMSGLNRDLVATLIARARADGSPRIDGVGSVASTGSGTPAVDGRPAPSFSEFLARTHLKSRHTRYLIFALVATAYIWRSTSMTWQATLVIAFAQLTVLTTFTWLAVFWTQPPATRARTTQLETFLCVASTVSMLMLPPLSYGTLSVSSSPMTAAMVLVFRPAIFTRITHA
jgi:hypothetical protein